MMGAFSSAGKLLEEMLKMPRIPVMGFCTTSRESQTSSRFCETFLTVWLDADMLTMSLPSAGLLESGGEYDMACPHGRGTTGCARGLLRRRMFGRGASAWNGNGLSLLSRRRMWWVVRVRVREATSGSFGNGKEEIMRLYLWCLKRFARAARVGVARDI